MLLSIPYQALEISKIHLLPFQSDKYGKALAKLQYKDTSVEFNDVSILTPPMKVIDYNPENSRLRLDLSQQFQFQIKMNTLQEYLAGTFYVHQQSFLSQRCDSSEDIRNMFHFILEGETLSLYIFPTANIRHEDGHITKMSEITPGDMIRCLIRFNGISQIKTKNGIKLRIQHTVPGIWYLT